MACSGLRFIVACRALTTDAPTPLLGPDGARNSSLDCLGVWQAELEMMRAEASKRDKAHSQEVTQLQVR